jgi:hypothetical protein
VLDPFSAYKYNQKADKVDFLIFENISYFGPSTSRGPTGGPKKIISPYIKGGRWAQMIPPDLNRVNLDVM